MSLYLDSNATTRVHPRVIEAMMPYLTESWHNPSSGYAAARVVREAIETARGQVAALIGAILLFVLPGDRTASAVTRAVIELARALDLELVAEGVEHEHQLHTLLALGCTHAQGYLLGRPVDAETFARTCADGV